MRPHDNTALKMNRKGWHSQRAFRGLAICAGPELWTNHSSLAKVAHLSGSVVSSCNCNCHCTAPGTIKFSTVVTVSSICLSACSSRGRRAASHRIPFYENFKRLPNRDTLLNFTTRRQNKRTVKNTLLLTLISFSLSVDGHAWCSIYPLWYVCTCYLLDYFIVQPADHPQSIIIHIITRKHPKTRNPPPSLP